MKAQLKTLSALAAAYVVLSASAIAVPIVLAANNPQADENVLLTGGASGAMIQGTLNQSGGILNFSSASGDLLSPSSGQAKIQAGAGNDPFTSLTFWLADGATFTSAIFNVFGDSGMIDISVSYLPAGGSPLVTHFDTGNGSNFFTVLSGADTRLTQIMLSTTNGTFNDLRQVRIGGYAEQPPAVKVPDNGQSIALIGLGLLALASLYRATDKR